MGARLREVRGRDQDGLGGGNKEVASRVWAQGWEQKRKYVRSSSELRGSWSPCHRPLPQSPTPTPRATVRGTEPLPWEGRPASVSFSWTHQVHTDSRPREGVAGQCVESTHVSPTGGSPPASLTKKLKPENEAHTTQSGEVRARIWVQRMPKTRSLLSTLRPSWQKHRAGGGGR